MSDYGNAYYPSDLDAGRVSIPKGRYTASIVSLEINKNVRFGSFLCDVFKPEYLIDTSEHPEYEGAVVKDNGIFRYKKVDDCDYSPQKNWGFAKFLSIMKIPKLNGQLPFLKHKDVENAKVLIDIYMKTFFNDLDSEVRYPVARVIQLLEKKIDVPF
jgi:hypothetical protein|tara:strand:- start:272 stop:742 length:471 start_codon:yes stop_codon:yes gene_type:complete